MNGHPKGSGFVRFEDGATCERAIGMCFFKGFYIHIYIFVNVFENYLLEKFHGYMYGGRHLDIRLDKYSTTV